MSTTENAKGAKRTAAVLALTYVGEAKKAIEAAIVTGALTEQEVWWLDDWTQRLTQLRIQLQGRMNTDVSTTKHTKDRKIF
jgi:hypothetical protein